MTVTMSTFTRLTVAVASMILLYVMGGRMGAFAEGCGDQREKGVNFKVGRAGEENGVASQSFRHLKLSLENDSTHNTEKLTSRKAWLFTNLLCLGH
jgi:hypothetical protein